MGFQLLVPKSVNVHDLERRNDGRRGDARYLCDSGASCDEYDRNSLELLCMRVIKRMNAVYLCLSVAQLLSDGYVTGLHEYFTCSDVNGSCTDMCTVLELQLGPQLTDGFHGVELRLTFRNAASTVRAVLV